MNQKLNNSQEHPTVNRQYKDRLFRMVFSRKEDLLSLYNAINGTSYSSAPKRLPFPQHIVFYNGTKDEPDRQILRLSDLFEKPSSDLTPCLECTSLMLNINYGHNQELMKKCRRLKEYSLFIDTVRRNLASGLPLERAVSRSVDECIQQDILRDILTAQKAEVIQVVLETFDQEKYEKAMKQEGYEDGYNAGKSDGYNSGRTDGYSAGREDGLRQLISTLMDIREKYGMSESEIITEISQKYNLTEAEAVQKINEFLAG